MGETPVLVAPPGIVAASVSLPAPLPVALAPLRSLPAAPDSRPGPAAAAGRELSTSAREHLRDAPSKSLAAAVVRGHSARASYRREQPAKDLQPAIAPRSSHVEAAPPRTAAKSVAAANIPATPVVGGAVATVVGSAVATTVVGPAPVLRAPVQVPALPAVAMAVSPKTERPTQLPPRRPVQSEPTVTSDPLSRPRKRVRDRADVASGGARPTLTPPREESARASEPARIPAPLPAGAKVGEAGTLAPRLARSALSRGLFPQPGSGDRSSPSLRDEAPAPVATPVVAVAAPTSPVVAASTTNGVASGAPAFVPRRPATAPHAAPIADDGAAEDTAVRAPKRASSTDLPVQVRPSDKAPPANTAENFTKVFGTPAAGDKSESPKPAPVHPATLIGHAPAASVPPHRPAPDRAAPPPLHAAATASQSPAHPAPSSRREPSTTRDAAAAIATTHAPLGDRAPVPTPHLVPQAPAPAPFDAVFASLPPPAPLPAAPSALLAHAAEDPSLRATVMPERAVLSIDTGGAGELALHLRVKDGVADVRVAGAAAHTVDMRPSELRAALASEGLTLGSFQSGQPAPEDNRGAERADDDPAVRAPSRAAPAATASSSTTTTTDSSPALTPRGLHVTA